MFFNTAPCLSAFPFWNGASVLIVLTRMLWDWAKVENSSELNSVPASTIISQGAPAQENHIWTIYRVTALDERSGAQQAAWKLVDQSTMWYMWNVVPDRFVHDSPSVQMRSLKSSSSRIVLGLAILGLRCDWQTEHWKSRAAWATSDRKPWFRNKVLNLSGLGCPRFLWALTIICCSSREMDRNLLVCLGFCTSSICDGVSMFSWGLAAGTLGIGWTGGVSASPGDLAIELGCDGENVSASGTGPASAVCWPTFSLLGRANIVIVIWLACDGRIRFLLASSSHSSQSVSALSCPLPLSVYTARRRGASPRNTFGGGAMVRLLPRHPTMQCISWEVTNCWMAWRMFASVIVRLPTLGSIFWTCSKTWFHSWVASSEEVLPIHFLRLPQGSSWIGLVGFFFNRESADNRGRLACLDDVSSAASTECELLYGGSCRTATRLMIMAKRLANFLGYRSVKADLLMLSPSTWIFPSITWCWWVPGHLKPERAWDMVSEVVRIVKVFLINKPLVGSFNSPATHRSTSTASMWKYTSCK